MNDDKSKRLGNGVIHLTGAKFIIMFITLISGMLLSRFRTVNEYGTYSQLSLVITLAISLFTLGFPESSNYFLARANSAEKRREFLSVFYTLNTLTCIVIGLVLLASIPLIEIYFKNDSIKKFAYFLAIYPWAKVTINTISNVLVVYGKTKKLVVINICTALVALASVLLIQLLGLAFADYVVSFLIGNVVIAIWIYFIVFKLEKGLTISLDKTLIIQILKYSIPIGLAALVSTINVEIDKFMIGGLVDTEALAYYTNAGKELPLSLVATSLTTILMPIMARKLKAKDNSSAMQLWGDAIQLSFILSCFFTVTCIVFAPQIITILYSQKYLPGVDVFRIYSFVLILRTTYWGMVLSAVGKTRLIFRASVFSLGLNVALNYLFYIAFGFIGPAIASVVSIASVSFFQVIQTSKTVDVPFSKIFPWKSLLKITMINITWGIAAWFTLKVLNIGVDALDIVMAIIIGILFSGIYVILLINKVKFLWSSLNNEKNTVEE